MTHPDRGAPSAAAEGRKDTEGPAACWVLVESCRGKPLRESLQALGAARAQAVRHEARMHAVCWGEMEARSAPVAMLASLGADEVVLLRGDPGAGTVLLADPIARHLQRILPGRGPLQVFFGPSPLSRAVAPRLAALLDVGYASRVTNLRKVGNAVRLTRPTLAGRLAEVLGFVPEGRGVVSLYPAAFPAPDRVATGREDETRIEAQDLDAGSPGPGRIRIVEHVRVGADSLDIGDAEVVVAGGRGLGSAEAFALVHRLAHLLGGAVAASRIAVDLGWADRSKLVGQTGRRIGPELYVACGISGAHQHRAGIQDARHVLAINHDPAAPIFQAATWGIVGDVLEVLPEMVRRLEGTEGGAP